MKIENVQLININPRIKNSSFKGYVNGNYYEDHIIEAANKAFGNPNWKDEFMAQKTSIGEAIGYWHNEDSAGLPARIAFGISSLGLTEVIFGVKSLIEATMNNKEINHTICQIEKCMNDLRCKV